METKLITNVLVGSDIEVFLYNTEAEEIVSAEGFIQGTKNKPFIFDPINNFFSTSLDNVLAEFTIPPASNKEEFYNYIQRSLAYINQTIPKGYCTVALPAANLAPKYLTTRQAKLFGCEPDYNAYTTAPNIRPYCKDRTLRSAGGHLHTSYNEPDDDTSRNIIKAYDLFIGIPSILQEPENKRKELYGKAGAHRLKKYGVEYRTLSNYYLASETLTKWVFEAATNAINWLNGGGALEPYMDKVIEDAINFNSAEMAKALIKDFNLQLAA